MSRVTIEEIAHGVDVDISDPNTTLSSWETASAKVNAANIREEGLDERSLADNSIMIDFQTIQSLNYQDVTDSGYTLYPIDTGYYEFKFDDTFDMSDATTTLVIRASLEFAMERVGAKNHFIVIHSTGYDQPIFSCVFRYSLDAGTTWTSIDETERHYGFHNSIAEGQGLAPTSQRPFEINTDGVKMRGSHTLAHIFNASDDSEITIGLFAKITQGTGSTAVRVRDITMTAEMFGR